MSTDEAEVKVKPVSPEKTEVNVKSVSTDETEFKIKQKHPQTYVPLRAEKIERGRSYASIMVNDQKTMMENLRFLRHQMEKEERQLKIMKNTLYDRSMPTRSKHRDYGSCNDLNMDVPLKKIPPNLSRSEMIEYGKLHANVLVNNQLAMMENLRYMRRQMEKEDRKISRTKDSTFRKSKPSKKEPDHLSKQVALYHINDTFKKWKKHDDDPLEILRTGEKIGGQKQTQRFENGFVPRSLDLHGYKAKNGVISNEYDPLIWNIMCKNPEKGIQEIIQYSQGDATGKQYHGLNDDGRRLLDVADYFFDKRSDMWRY